MGVKWEIKRWVSEFDGPALWGADCRRGGVLVECHDFATHAEALEYVLSRSEGRRRWP